jgi:hypothetical protein
MLRGVHVTDPTELSHDVLLRVAEFLRKLPSDQLADLAKGAAKLELVPKAVPLPRRSKPVELPKPADEIGAALAAAPDRASAVSYLDDLRLTVAQLRSLARALGIAVPSRANRAQTRDTLVHWTEDRRVAAALLGRPEPQRRRRVDHTA